MDESRLTWGDQEVLAAGNLPDHILDPFLERVATHPDDRIFTAIDPEGGERHDYRPAPLVQMEGTGRWAKAAVELDRCQFLGRQNMSADVRLIPNRRGVAVRGVRVEAR